MNVSLSAVSQFAYHLVNVCTDIVSNDLAPIKRFALSVCIYIYLDINNDITHVVYSLPSTPCHTHGFNEYIVFEFLLQPSNREHAAAPYLISIFGVV